MHEGPWSLSIKKCPPRIFLYHLYPKVLTQYPCLAENSYGDKTQYLIITREAREIMYLVASVRLSVCLCGFTQGTLLMRWISDKFLYFHVKTVNSTFNEGRARQKHQCSGILMSLNDVFMSCMSPAYVHVVVLQFKSSHYTRLFQVGLRDLKSSASSSLDSYYCHKMFSCNSLCFIGMMLK